MKSKQTKRTAKARADSLQRRVRHFEICGVVLTSVRAANVFENLLRAKKLLVYEELKECPWWGKPLKQATPKEIAASVTLDDLKKTRNCGKLCISEITAALIKAKARPGWTWPEKKKLPKWIVQKCPCCGQRLYA